MIGLHGLTRYKLPFMNYSQPTVGLFVTCIVDIMRPNIGFAAIKLLEHCNCVVEVPENQTCCGQPAYNSGDSKTTTSIAMQVIKAFEHYDYVVAPSGSCAAMIKVHFPELFENDKVWFERATLLADKTHELISFLVDIRDIDISQYKSSKRFASKVITYHDSCSGYRELGIYKQPRALLKAVECEVTQMQDSTECCGFGGTFCVKYPDISNAMVTDKSNNIKQTGADVLVGGDYSCLMNIAGKLNREQSKIQTYHVAELIADIIDQQR